MMYFATFAYVGKPAIWAFVNADDSLMLGFNIHPMIRIQSKDIVRIKVDACGYEDD